MSSSQRLHQAAGLGHGRHPGLQPVPGVGHVSRRSFTLIHIIILPLRAVGGLGLTRDTFRAAWALPALALYPLSLGAVWWLDTYLGWQ